MAEGLLAGWPTVLADAVAPVERFILHKLKRRDDDGMRRRRGYIHPTNSRGFTVN